MLQLIRAKHRQLSTPHLLNDTPIIDIGQFFVEIQLEHGLLEALQFGFSKRTKGDLAPIRSLTVALHQAQGDDLDCEYGGTDVNRSSPVVPKPLLYRW